MTTQTLAAVGVVLCYALLCWFFWGRHKAPHSAQDHNCENALLVAYASQSGHAEQLARLYASTLQQKVVVLSLNQIDRNLIEKTTLALFFVSTYGEGEPPDNALRFYQQWLRKSSSEALSDLHFAVLALGDSAYRQFCHFGTLLTDGLLQHGATTLFDTVKIDKLDTSQLAFWEEQLIHHGFTSSVKHGDLPQPIFATGQLLEQRCINLGSPGEPVWHLRISPPPDILWQAGDILEIQPFNDPAKPVREYSIASLPEDGSIDLLVRQLIKADGSSGVGSGWLTQIAKPGSDITLRIRRNPLFHAPAPETPIILIGNGTGMAGLRVHLKARQLAGAKQNCLFFGERTRANDFFFQDEIQSLQQTGFLPLSHVAFSRDQERKRYVQDLLGEESTLIKDWVNHGAAIYVCGSLDGMAGAVDDTLQAILGMEKVEQMKIKGSYARDVY